MHRLHESRSSHLVLKGIPDLADGLGERRLGDRDAAPDGVEQLVLGHEHAGAFREVAEDGPCLRPQRDRSSAGPQKPGLEVQPIGRKDDLPASRRPRHGSFPRLEHGQLRLTHMEAVLPQAKPGRAGRPRDSRRAAAARSSARTIAGGPRRGSQPRRPRDAASTNRWLLDPAAANPVEKRSASATGSSDGTDAGECPSSAGRRA